MIILPITALVLLLGAYLSFEFELSYLLILVSAVGVTYAYGAVNDLLFESCRFYSQHAAVRDGGFCHAYVSPSLEDSAVHPDDMVSRHRREVVPILMRPLIVSICIARVRADPFERFLI